MSNNITISDNKIKEILSIVDHTELSPAATLSDIKKLCDQAITYETASVCIPPAYVKDANLYLTDKSSSIPVCTVIGFPLGYSTTDIKLYETKKALEDGAEEIDMVINIGQLKAGNYDYVKNEISLLKEVCNDKCLKVIIETALLTNEEKIKMCEIVTDAGADFIKTSTGFSTEGATFEDIELFAKHVGKNVKIKAAGGIKDFDDALRFIELGANRLGTSRLVKILES